jgi:hypothetical protein
MEDSKSRVGTKQRWANDAVGCLPVIIRVKLYSCSYMGMSMRHTYTTENVIFTLIGHVSKAKCFVYLQEIANGFFFFCEMG